MALKIEGVCIMKKICFYGKGGIGKSTIVSNLACAFADMGNKVAVVGCDPKADSTRNIMGRKIDTVLNTDDYVHYGYKDILCIESGGPSPGTGCAGRGIVAALDKIKADDVLKEIDIAIYDVLGDVVCGGFSAPLRNNVCEDVYVISTSDYMALYAANNICKGIEKYTKSTDVRLCGIVLNERSSTVNNDLVAEISNKIGTRVIGNIPMSKEISKSEINRKTVIEMFPDNEITSRFRALAQSILDNNERCVPAPISDEELEEICIKMS